VGKYDPKMVGGKKMKKLAFANNDKTEKLRKKRMKKGKTNENNRYNQNKS